jgi:hypothetical protein
MIQAKQVAGAIRADGTAPFTGNQSLGGFKLTNVATPVASGDAARKDSADLKTLMFGQWQQLQASALTAARFVLPGGGSNANTNENLSVVLAPAAGTLTGLYVFHGVAMTTDSITYTLRVNGVDSSIVVAMAAAQTAGNILGQSVAVNAGDRVTIKSVQSSTEAKTTLASGLSLLWRSAG